MKVTILKTEDSSGLGINISLFANEKLAYKAAAKWVEENVPEESLSDPEIKSIIKELKLGGWPDFTAIHQFDLYLWLDEQTVQGAPN